jgi:hypothetical protein
MQIDTHCPAWIETIYLVRTKSPGKVAIFVCSCRCGEDPTTSTSRNVVRQSSVDERARYKDRDWSIYVWHANRHGEQGEQQISLHTLPARATWSHCRKGVLCLGEAGTWMGKQRKAFLGVLCSL